MIKLLENSIERVAKMAFYVLLMVYPAKILSQQASQLELPQKWDLQTCIDYALANNIQVKTAEANRDIAAVNIKLANAAYLPSVSASIGQNLNDTPFAENGSSSSMAATGSYGINLSWQLLDGGVRSTNSKQADIDNQIAGLAIEESKNSIKLAIIQNYMQILYAYESEKHSRMPWSLVLHSSRVTG